MAFSKFMVSACLAGIKCRYDGEDKKAKKVFQQVKKGKALPFCPEQLAGLSTPRKTCGIRFNCGRKLVLCSTGEDMTQRFLRGALLSWRIADRFRISSALLKSGSPSCGSGIKNKKEIRTGVTFALFDKKRMKIALR